MLRTARAIPTLLRVGLAEAVAYRAEFLVWLLSTNMPLVMLALWSAVARDGPVGGYDQEGFAAYYLAALVVRLMTGAWVIWEMNLDLSGLGTWTSTRMMPFFCARAMASS